MNADDLRDDLPMFFPRTNAIDGCEMVARYPVDNWIDHKATYFSAARRRRAAMKIAKMGTVNLHKVFLTAKQESRELPEEFPKDKISNDGTDAFAKAAKGMAADCQRGQDVCVCGERLPRKMSRASSSRSLTSDSSYSLPSATP